MDEHNKRLVAEVHPPNWVNPSPKKKYDLVVIGAGTAGLVTAAGAAGLGAKVALIERHLMGGDCLNVGCVPSKGIISAARFAKQFSRLSEFGATLEGNVHLDFGKIMERMRRLRADISPDDSAQRFSDLGIDVFLGQGSFKNSSTVTVAEKELHFKKAVIASGARAIELPIEGLSEAGYVTNETIFSLTQLPKTLGVIGAGPIGCEMAQTFQRLGSQVTLLNNTEHILPREDGDAARIVEEAMLADGVAIHCKVNMTRVQKEGSGKRVFFEQEGQEESVYVDELLLAVGRGPNIEGLNLEGVGVEYDSKGVKVDDFLQTTNSKIYAAGDICMNWKFTHTADFAARAVIQNALFAIGPFGKKRLSSFLVPWVTFTEPEIAHVGMYAKDAMQKGIEIETVTKELSEVHRALLDGESEGFVRIHVEKKTGKMLGGTIVASHAGEMIGELCVAISQKMKLSSLASVIHPYPTQAEAIRLAGDIYNRGRLTEKVKKILKLFISLRR